VLNFNNMLFGKKTNKKGCYSSLSSSDKKKIVSSAMRKANDEQIELVKKFNKEFLIKEAVK